MFFFNDTATTEIYTLSLHDALPIFLLEDGRKLGELLHRGVARHDLLVEDTTLDGFLGEGMAAEGELDRKSTRLNSSHSQISYAVFCLKKKIAIFEMRILAHDRHAAT